MHPLGLGASPRPGVAPDTIPRGECGTQGQSSQHEGPTTLKPWMVPGSNVSGGGTQGQRTGRDGLEGKKS
jgi:hypothetical protein